MTGRILVIGVGNPARRDDGAGPAVVAALRERLGVDAAKRRGVRLIDHWGEGTSLAAAMAGWPAVVIVDAAIGSVPPGSYRRFHAAAAAAALPAGLGETSTHGFGVAHAVELARALGALPLCCLVYAIGAHAFEHHAPLCDAVARTVDAVADRIIADIAERFPIADHADNVVTRRR
jgi:hydrogenase maturation protease